MPHGLNFGAVLPKPYWDLVIPNSEGAFVAADVIGIFKMGCLQRDGR